MGNANYGINTEDNRIAELENKTVREVIDLIGDNVKIGTKDGGGFFFCGDKRKFMEKIEDIDIERRARLQHACNKAESTALAMCKAPHAGVEDYLAALLKNAKSVEDINPTYDGYIAFVKRRIDEAKRKAEFAAKKKRQQEEYQPLEERIVIEAYPSVSEKDTTILLVKGGEVGWYWTTDECEKEMM